MGFRSAYNAGRKQFHQLANTMEKRLGGGTITKTATAFTGSGILGGINAGSVKSLIPSEGASEIKGHIKMPSIEMPKIENPKVQVGDVKSRKEGEKHF